ncbi:hypothetical protein OAN21_02735 [Alphaproteobacteria bacterium]|nr:hypothetical protein [Alphaproteobacteria bacterium]
MKAIIGIAIAVLSINLTALSGSYFRQEEPPAPERPLVPITPQGAENWVDQLPQGTWPHIFSVCQDQDWTSLQYDGGDWVDRMTFDRLAQALNDGALRTALENSSDIVVQNIANLLPYAL